MNINFMSGSLINTICYSSRQRAAVSQSFIPWVTVMLSDGDFGIFNVPSATNTFPVLILPQVCGYLFPYLKTYSISRDNPRLAGFMLDLPPTLAQHQEEDHSHNGFMCARHPI